jgi:hypothetical protein
MSSVAAQMAREWIGDWVGVDERPLSGQELHFLQDEALKKARLSLDTTLTQYRLQVAQAHLTGTLPPASSTLDSWKSEDQTWYYFHDHRDQIPLPDPIPLKLVAPSDGSLVSVSDVTDPAALAVQLNVDLLFWGKLSTQGRVWSLKLGLWSRLENRNLKEWRDRFSPDEIKQRMEKAHEAFEEVFLGRPWAGIRLSGEPSSIIFRTERTDPDEVSKMVLSGTPLVLDDLLPGPLTVHAEAPGFASQTQTYNLQPGVTAHETIKLVSDERKGPLIDSLPPGANVWIDSQWIGVTPVRVMAPVTRESLRVELAGHEPLVTDLEPGARDRTFLLTPPVPKPNVQAAKDRFYFSLAVFSFSLTTTIFAHALSDQWTALTNQYAAAYLGNPTPQIYQNYTDAYHWQQGFQYTSYAGLALTTGVFVWMMMELSTYLQDAEPR